MKAFSISRFGTKVTARTGILELMDDLGRAMSAGGPELCMLGGGNPARIPEMEHIWRDRMQALMQKDHVFENLMANYDTPQGNPEFLAAFAGYLADRYGWAVTERNILVTNGSQQSFFLLLNLFGGPDAKGRIRKIHMPLMPEYIGYADQGIADGLFAATRPTIEHRADGYFKYHIDRNAFRLGDDAGAICVSRPTNPTGNVLTDDEVRYLHAQAEQRGIPLIVDNAYGAPFPHILFKDVSLYWDPQVILTCSLSKLGLPGTRTGIVIADESIVDALVSMNAVISLANGNLGQALVTPLLRTGELERMGRDIIRPFYEARKQRAERALRAAFDASIPVHLHVPEGALFLWLWFQDLPVSTRVLYQMLKKRGVIVVPGEYFFYGLESDWPHAHQCIRVNYALKPDAVERGIGIIAEEVKRIYAGA